MPSDFINFGPHKTNENCSNFVQIVPAKTGNSSHFTYYTQMQHADVEYLSRVKMAQHSHVGSTNFTEPANIR